MTSRSKLSIGHILEAQYLGIVGESIRPVILIHCYPRCGERKILYRSSTMVINYSLSKVRVVNFITKTLNLSNRAIILS